MKPERVNRRPQIWHSGPMVREGIHRFVHIVRSADDPTALERSKRKGKALAWKTQMHPGTKSKWKKAILELLQDEKPRTFNHIMLELTGGLHTADVAFEKAPDEALWELVNAMEVVHTNHAPILFRIRGVP